MESLKIVITLMVIATAFLVGGSVALAQSGANAPATANLTLRDGVNPGEVVVSWDAVPEATYYRIGYVNMVTDYPLAKASRTGNWLEAFVYVDVEAQNFAVVNGRAEYTVRRLEQDARHAFTVLTSNSFSNTTETVVSTFSWPSNPRWRFLTVADRGGAPAPASPTVDYVSMYPNCDAVRAHYPGGVRQGSPIYRSALDPDGDGLACEPVGTPSGTPSGPTEARIDVSSTSASATVEMKLTIDNFPMNAVAGSSIDLYLEDDFQVPDNIDRDSVYFQVINRNDARVNGGGRVYTADPVEINDGNHYGGRDDWSIQVYIPDMDTSDTAAGAGFDGPKAGDTLVLTFSKDAGIKNPSEEGTHSVGYSILGPNDKPNEGPTGQLGATVTYAKISLSDEDNTRGYRLTVTGSGFNNGATAAVYVLSRVPATGRECEDIIANGTRVGSATVGSDDRVSVTFAVTVPPFVPGNQNYICMADSEGRMSKTDVEQFTLEPTIRATPTAANAGDTVTVFAQDFPITGAAFTRITLDGRAVSNASGTNISPEGSATATFTVPNGISGVVLLQAEWTGTIQGTRITINQPASRGCPDDEICDDLSNTQLANMWVILWEEQNFSGDYHIEVSANPAFDVDSFRLEVIVRSGQYSANYCNTSDLFRDDGYTQMGCPSLEARLSEVTGVSANARDYTDGALRCAKHSSSTDEEYTYACEWRN